MRVEWPTVLLLSVCVLIWGAALFWIAPLSLALAFPVLVIALVLHAQDLREY